MTSATLISLSLSDKMRRNCRIWWPKQLSSKDPSLCNLLFGWFVSCCEASLDIVVAFECNQAAVPDSQSGLEDILHNINGILHESLQEKSTFSLLRQCTAQLSNEQVSQNGMKEEQRKSLMKEDVVDIRNLSLVYILAGVDCIDCATDASVVSAVNEGIEAAREIVPLWRPWVMVSINDDKDLHFRKAGENKFIPAFTQGAGKVFADTGNHSICVAFVQVLEDNRPDKVFYEGTMDS